MPPRVLLAGPCRLTREGLSALLEDSGEWQVAGSASGPAETVRLWTELRPDVTVLEIGSPATRGLDAAVELGRCFPASKRIALTGNSSNTVLLEAIRSGIQGCLSLAATPSEFFNALRVVAAGGSCFVAGPHEDLKRSRSQEAPPLRPHFNVLDQLTRREKQVLRLVASGLSSRRIATELGLSPETVRSYRKSLMRKLGVSGVAGLVPLAVAADILKPNAPSSCGV